MSGIYIKHGNGKDLSTALSISTGYILIHHLGILFFHELSKFTYKKCSFALCLITLEFVQ